MRHYNSVMHTGRKDEHIKLILLIGRPEAILVYLQNWYCIEIDEVDVILVEYLVEILLQGLTFTSHRVGCNRWR